AGKPSSNGVYGDTWIWNGASRAWGFKTTLSNPRPRTRHVMAPNGEGVIMLGGQDHAGVPILLSAPLLFSGGNWIPRGSDLIYSETLVLAAAAGAHTAGGSFYGLGIVDIDDYGLAVQLPCC